MELMFSEETPAELKEQVGNDIKAAEKDGVVDTEEVKYEKQGNGDVAITDKETGEITVASRNPEEAETYDLIAVPDGQLERFAHPSDDGVTPGSATGAPDEKASDHFDDSKLGVKAETVADQAFGEKCPNCGASPCQCEDEGKQFSISSENDAWQKIFSMPQEFVDYLFSEVIESEETAKVGDLKVEKLADEDNAVVVTSEATGDQVKVKLDDNDMEVTELDSKAFCEGQYLPYIIVGVQPYDHVIVEAQEYDLESAQALQARLEADGVEAIKICDDPEAARDYAYHLLVSLGANPEEGEVEESQEQKEFSAYYDCPCFYTARYYTDNTVMMSRMFSETEAGTTDTVDAVYDAIRGGHEVEFEGGVVTPIDALTAIVQDGVEFTKAKISGEDVILEEMDPEDAKEVLDGEDLIVVDSDMNEAIEEADDYEDEAPVDEDEDEEKEFSDYFDYSNEDGTKFFSENEEMTDYMARLFSDEAEQSDIEEAIEEGTEIENDNEIITPVDAKSAIVEDKETGELSKVTILNDDMIVVHPIDEDDADDQFEDVVVAPNKESENALAEEEGEIKNYSYVNDKGTKFFSESEEMTNYMARLFSDEASEDEIEDAIEDGQQIENDNEIITPIDDTTAVIEDKETGDFHKAEIKDEVLDINPISEEEADELTKDLKVEKTREEEIEEKGYSSCDPIAKFFTEQVIPAAASPQSATGQEIAPQPAATAPAAQPVVAEAPVEEESHTVEEIEDKALAAVQSINAAAAEAVAQVMDAKAQPAPNMEPDIKEAQFSERTFSQSAQDDTLISWLQYK